MAMLLAACGEKTPPAPAEPMAPGVLSPEWVYTPATEETARATGPLTVEPGISADGPQRTLRTVHGDALHAGLIGAADLAASIELRSIADVLELRPGARAMLYRVDAGNLCLGGQATHLVWYEPEIIEGRSLALAVIAGGAPGETGSTVCRVLRYTRERTGGAAVNQGIGEAR